MIGFYDVEIHTGQLIRALNEKPVVVLESTPWHIGEIIQCLGFTEVKERAYVLSESFKLKL